MNFLSADERGKINAANIYGGPMMAIKMVNAYFATDIQYYILVNMVGPVHRHSMTSGE